MSYSDWLYGEELKNLREEDAQKIIEKLRITNPKMAQQLVDIWSRVKKRENNRKSGEPIQGDLFIK